MNFFAPHGYKFLFVQYVLFILSIFYSSLTPPSIRYLEPRSTFTSSSPRACCYTFVDGQNESVLAPLRMEGRHTQAPHLCAGRRNLWTTRHLSTTGLRTLGTPTTLATSSLERIRKLRRALCQAITWSDPITFIVSSNFAKGVPAPPSLTIFHQLSFLARDAPGDANCHSFFPLSFPIVHTVSIERPTTLYP